MVTLKPNAALIVVDVQEGFADPAWGARNNPELEANVGALVAHWQETGRPIVVVQGDTLNRSRIATVLCVPLTSNLHWASAPGNVALPSRATNLPRESVANVSKPSHSTPDSRKIPAPWDPIHFEDVGATGS